MKKSILVAGAMALVVGILQSNSIALAHGFSRGHHGGGYHGGGHHGGGHHGGSHNVNIDIHDDHHDGGAFWAGAAVGGLIGYGAANANDDPCNHPDYRETYPGKCNN
jgi:hypothetical protein